MGVPTGSKGYHAQQREILGDVAIVTGTGYPIREKREEATPMNRDNATKIAKRIMARIEDERTIHLDSMVDEIVAGMALVTEVARRPEWTDEEQKKFHAKNVTVSSVDKWNDYKQLCKSLRSDEAFEMVWGCAARDLPIKGSMTIAEPNIGIGGSKFQVFGDGIATSNGKMYLTTGFDVASWDCDPTSGEAEAAPLPAAQNPHGYAHEDCHGVWTKQQMIDAGYRNNLEVMRYQPAKPPKARKGNVPISGDYAVAMRWSQQDLYDAGYTPTHHFLLGVQWEPKFD